MNWRWRLFGRTRAVRGHSLTVRLPSYEELRALWDRDHYARLALRTKLRQAGILRPKTRFVREWPLRSRGLGASASWGSGRIVEAERQRYAHNWAIFKRYERRVVPSPLVRAIREEMRGMIVDLQQFERKMMLRDGRGDTAQSPGTLWDVAWPGALWLVGVGVGILIGWGWWG